MIYLASPYSDRSPTVREYRYNCALEIVGRLIEAKKPVYSPIVHFHEVAKHFKLPKDNRFWKLYNVQMISKCDDLYVLLLKGWFESKGIMFEIKVARDLVIPVSYINMRYLA